LDLAAPVLQALRSGRSRRAVQDNPFFSRQDVRDLPDGNDQEKPAEQTATDGDQARSIAAGPVPHVRDEANPAQRRVDAETLAASKPVAEVRGSTLRNPGAGSHRPPFRLDSLSRSVEEQERDIWSAQP